MTDDTTVLVLEDEQGLADLYATWLGVEYDVRVTTTAAAARERADAAVDVALIDRRLPDEPGDAVLAWLREQPFDCTAAMLTAVHPGDDLLDLPVDDYLLKPVDRGEVEAAVDRLDRLGGYGDAARRVASLSVRLAFLRDNGRGSGGTGTRAELREQLRSALSSLADAETPADGIEDLTTVLPDDPPVQGGGVGAVADGRGRMDGVESGTAASDGGGSSPRTDGGRPIDGDRSDAGSGTEADRDDPGPQDATEPDATGGSGGSSGSNGSTGSTGSSRTSRATGSGGSGGATARPDAGVTSPGEDGPSPDDADLSVDVGEPSGDLGEERRRFDGSTALTVRYDPDADQYRATHDWDDDGSLVVTIVEAVAAVDDRSTRSLGPLHDRIDAHALDSLFGDGSHVDGAVTFEYGGYRVTVDDDGEVLVDAESRD